MTLYNTSSFSIYFGDSTQSIEPQKCKSLTSSSLFAQAPFNEVQKGLNLSTLIFLHQVHKADGLIIKNIKESQNLSLFCKEGDYLITNQAAVGLGVVTADCLPIVFYDQIKNVIAVAHAGWRGSVGGIAAQVVFDLQQHFSSNKKDIKIFFGPTAKGCCYEVDDPFVEKIGLGNSVKKALSKKNNRYYFDSTLYNTAELISIGFSYQQIVFDYAVCTICNNNFCSYRRQKGLSDRQITVVSLK